MAVILQVSFQWDDDEQSVHATSVAEARRLSARTEFVWKMILRDPETKTSGAVYLFESRQGAQAWRAELFERRGQGIEARIFEIDEEASRLTRAPLAARSAEPPAILVDELNASNDE